MPKTYRRKGDVLAEQLTSENADELARWCNGVVVEEIDPEDESNKYAAINVPSPHGAFRVSQGYYLILNEVTGNFKVMTPSTFRMLFEEA